MAAEQLIQATIGTLRPHAPFDAMEPPALRLLASRLRLAYFPKGEVVVGPGSGRVSRLYIVKQGVVQGVPSAEARDDKLVDLVHGPGECFPIGALIGGRETAYRYAATEDSFVYELEEADFRRVLDSSSAFQRYCTAHLSTLLEQSRRALRAQAADALADEGRMLAPLRGLIRRAAVSCTAQTPIREVLATMQEQGIGSMVIVNERGAPEGIFTLPDLLSRVALGGAELAAPVAGVMTPRPFALPADAPVYEAALAMARHAIRHILLVEEGRLCGVVSERDLFSLQGLGLRRAADAVRAARDAASLAQAAAAARGLAGGLLAQGMSGEQVTQVASSLNDGIVRRAVEIAAADHALQGRWCWIALGSEGRMEQTLATDQDNALILDAQTGAKAPFLAFADAVNRTLDACGFPLCRGDIMARNPRWCLTLAEWRATFLDWMRNSDPEALLHGCIFFDFRAVAGEPQFADELREWLLAKAAATPAFLHLMAGNALSVRPPLGLWRDFVTATAGELRGTIDLKTYGARPFVDVARVWALARGLAPTNTAQRLRAAAAAGLLPMDEALAAIEAFHFVQTLRLRQQHFGRPAAGGENCIDPAALNALDRRILKEALRHASKLQERLRLDYQLQRGT